MIRMQAGTYELIEESRNGWNPEMFKERYSDILDKYDYIVGDWGYGQLRLRGFYENTNRKVPFEQKIATLDEYLQEFCNFGCPYFVLRRTKAVLRTDGDGTGVEAELAEQAESPASANREQMNRYARPMRQDRAPRPQRKDQRSARPDRPGQDRTEKNKNQNRAGRDKIPTGAAKNPASAPEGKK